MQQSSPFPFGEGEGLHALFVLGRDVGQCQIPIGVPTSISVNRQNRPLSAEMPLVEAVGELILSGNCQDQNHKRKFMVLLLHRIAASLVLPRDAMHDLDEEVHQPINDLVSPLPTEGGKQGVAQRLGVAPYLTRRLGRRTEPILAQDFWR
jgi:hypothetical protein